MLKFFCLLNFLNTRNKSIIPYLQEVIARVAFHMAVLHDLWNDLLLHTFMYIKKLIEVLTKSSTYAKKSFLQWPVS